MADSSKASRLAVGAWVLYDLSNTVFAASILSFGLRRGGSVIFGFLTDRIGPKRTLGAVIVLWLVAIVLSAGALEVWMLFLAGPIIGVALGGMWTVGRVMLVALSPPAKMGEFFGLFSLAVIMAAGLFFLLRVPDARSAGRVDEFAPLDSPAS